MSLQELAERVMPRTEEGEFELVLGNKQLLSIFFIVVVLLGVFFSMGYIVGRNTAGQTMASLAPGQPLVVESEAASKPAASSAEPSAEPAPVPPAPRSQPAPAMPTEAMVPAQPSQVARPEPRVTRAPAPPAPAASGGVAEPPHGTTWLQVAATSQPEGEVLRDVLAKRGFGVQLAPVPDQDIVRVLVGPVSGEEVSVTRNQLQEAGFKPFARKY